MLRNKSNITFYFKTESIIMEYNKSYHIFHTWGDMRNKNNLDRFAKKIINSKDLDLNKVIKWSREHKLTHNSTSRRVLDEIQSAKKG